MTVRLPILAVALILAELTPAPFPTEFTSLGRDFIVAGVLFYFYRQISSDFRQIVKENTAALQKLSDQLDNLRRDTR